MCYLQTANSIVRKKVPEYHRTRGLDARVGGSHVPGNEDPSLVMLRQGRCPEASIRELVFSTLWPLQAIYIASHSLDDLTSLPVPVSIDYGAAAPFSSPSPSVRLSTSESVTFQTSALQYSWEQLVSNRKLGRNESIHRFKLEMKIGAIAVLQCIYYTGFKPAKNSALLQISSYPCSSSVTSIRAQRSRLSPKVLHFMGGNPMSVDLNCLLCSVAAAHKVSGCFLYLWAVAMGIVDFVLCRLPFIYPVRRLE